MCVGSGRDSVAAAAALKEASGGAAFVVTVQHPRCRLSLFDMVVAPQHDLPARRPPRANLTVTVVRPS